MFKKITTIAIFSMLAFNLQSCALDISLGKSSCSKGNCSTSSSCYKKDAKSCSSSCAKGCCKNKDAKACAADCQKDCCKNKEAK